MNLPQQLANQFRAVHFGGNWTVSNVKDSLSEVTWEQAITKVESFNTIATLVFHINYFVSEALLKVLQGEMLNAHDKYSFAHPPIESKEDWDRFLEKVFSDAEQTALLIEKLPESKLWEDFSEKKYGNYYRNIQGIVEHTHYHLGQINLIKKLLK